MLTVVAFIVALGLLIAVHEYGHYRVAVACGVKVLRFSVGFGKTLYRWQPKKQQPGQDTEFVIGAFPLGGYVKMLDEREGAGRPGGAPPGLQHPAAEVARRHRGRRAGGQPAAGDRCCTRPSTGMGVQEPQARAGQPGGRLAWPSRPACAAASVVEQAGFDGEASQPVRSFEDLRWLLTRGALDGRDVRLAAGRRGAAAGANWCCP